MAMFSSMKILDEWKMLQVVVVVITTLLLLLFSSSKLTSKVTTEKLISPPAAREQNAEYEKGKRFKWQKTAKYI